MLYDLNIYLVIDSKKAENKFEAENKLEDIEKRLNDDQQKWSYVTI